MTPEEKIIELGFQLPAPVAPLASYVPVQRTGNLLHISGQLPMDAEGLRKGRLGDNVGVEQAQQAAQICALNILGQIKSSAGVDLSNIKQVIKLGVFVACTDDFNEHHLVANGASDLIGQFLGDKGKHARAAVGVPSLPLGAVVEIEAIVEIAD
ncbi:RidA family protein [Maritalea porphyrae]|uniref:RidA family protein n=1 Tax=Maritalea porphyrae TaxID=880732 RepID=UPI0022AF2846|nr:RidA family protein [Maritalea porphyrae]MCZ4272905.1 RidA family protein [Maritalea porphyrae]